MLFKKDCRVEYTSRTNGIVSEATHDKVILAVGTGAGSYMIEKLARVASPAEIRLIDFDTVEWPNLSRTAYGVGDVGRLKVDALSDRIREANPFVDVVVLPLDICGVSAERCCELTRGADLIIAGTDHFPAQARLNTLSLQYGIPCVFIGIHAGALGGRVIWSVPGETGCYRCVAPERYAASQNGDSEDTDLDAAHGALPDIQFIDMVALKICLAILERGHDSSMGRFFKSMAGRNEVIIRTSPEYAHGSRLWDAVLSDLPTSPRRYADEIKDQVLFAMDTLWFRVDSDPGCLECRVTPESRDE